MKVLMICATKMDNGGIENYVMSLFRNFPTTIHVDFVVHSQEIGCLEKEINESGSVIYKLPRLSKKPFTYFNNLYKIVKSGNYDIVHRHATASVMWIDLAIAKLSGCKIRIAHSHSSNWSHKYIHKLGIPLLNYFTTEKFACSTLAGKWMYGDAEFKVVNNGIDEIKYQYDEKIRRVYREKLEINNKIVVLMVARMDPVKNHLWLVNVIKEICTTNNEYLFVFAGDGILLNEFRNRIKENNLDKYVIILGNRNDISELMSMSDILVLPSTYEGLPITVVEGQCSGLKCIISNNITSEVDFGYVKKLPLNTTDWKNEILKDLSMNNDHRNNAIEMILNNNYSLKQTTKIMEEYYKKCVQ